MLAVAEAAAAHGYLNLLSQIQQAYIPSKHIQRNRLNCNCFQVIKFYSLFSLVLSFYELI